MEERGGEGGVRERRGQWRGGRGEREEEGREGVGEKVNR